MSYSFKVNKFEKGKAKRRGYVAWRSPSNIALIKYWGKHGRQLPKNPSLSFSLTEAHTDTSISYETREYESDECSLEFYFEGKPNEAFKLRLTGFLNSIIEFFPMLKYMDLHIESSNSFPHSSGIASSASSMSALALCLCSIEQELFESTPEDKFLKKASYIARLGSGSACRSVYGGFCIWGDEGSDQLYTDDYAVGFDDVHEVYQSLHDDILIVSAKEKSVSSSVGHQLMETNPYAQVRYENAEAQLLQLKEHLSCGDIMAFGKIVEEEALSLHALMMCSDPSFILMEPNSLKIIEEIRSFRTETGLPIFFTLDAGPNLHVIYPDNIMSEARTFIEERLIPLCEKGQHIYDFIGTGPVELSKVKTS